MPMPMKSALAKKMDQLFLSRAELRKNRQVAKVKKIVALCNSVVLVDCKDMFGEMFVRRLKKSAKRAGRSVVGYCADVLVS
jgi:hypothetical protein